MDERELLKIARKNVSKCVDEVILTLQDESQKNDWEFDWFVDEFRNQFNKAVRKIMGEKE